MQDYYLLTGLSQLGNSIYASILRTAMRIPLHAMSVFLQPYRDISLLPIFRLLTAQ